VGLFGLLILVVGPPDVWSEHGGPLLRRLHGEHHFQPLSFVESLVEGLEHGEADMLAQRLRCETPQESVKGQLLLGSSIELHAMSDVQPHVCGKGAHVLPFITEMAG